MSLTQPQQFDELTRKATRPLIILPPYAHADALASALALALSFEKNGQEAVIAGDTLKEDLQPLHFLQQSKDLRNSITGARDFVLVFNTARNAISDIRTERSPEELRVYLTPEHGSIDPRDFSFMPAQFIFDLAIVIGAPDKEHLGKIYENNPDIFFEMPIINIDNHADNELFGQLNCVDVKASSIAEILSDLFLSREKGAVPAGIEEHLLTGIITATDSFQKKSTTPKSLQLASLLMQAGADQQKIIRSLYKTQPLHLLKLWGKAMAQVKWNEKLELVWSLVTIEDVVHARARIDDLPEVLEKIKLNYATAKLFVILTPETQSVVRILLKTPTRESLQSLQRQLPESEILGETLLLRLSAESLEQAEEILFEKLEKALL